ncbi:23S rRNA (uracil(1939)-C(5))-methyltransferase RlmD [Pyrococcus abyssi]|uniref:tRNA (uracil(54)-C(5))-methyltransferase n=2 Tax=Pyrococcus abyssi TaxID=29292 RepID=ATRMA_PYRAB|nr:23S rRNA (uracil(1939)-C(5))-methyltransferase RlmD [Pyrococcus abyssi]Q9UZR7.1 RecName: Full=tRNA (uracil(54)-C(5))-methyltransferase; AltName: Full=PabTrmU54; AltName: Full=tRNA(m5U54)-methyltransferase; Short=RUMT [Pyrococcus abyssi GE5]CAB49989.1 RNA methyltransferase, putative [Pyrococcus abyssi GE5]CCE70489.1 TPA: putative RNA methyltransferase [Pyrococcus abyssi GE5]
MRGVIRKLNDDGFGVLKGILVPFSAPGDEIIVERVERVKKRRVASQWKLVRSSPLRVGPRCKAFGKCGGCTLQHLNYDYQLEFKRKKLKRILGFEVEVVPSPKIFGHRNRIDLAITKDGIGFRERGKWWKIVDIDECPVFGKTSREAIERLKEFIEEEKISVWNIKKDEGFLRYMVLREGKFTEEVMVNFVTKEGNLPDPTNYFDFDSIYWSVNRSKSDVSYGDIERFWGKEFIRERLDDVDYLIHPNSFFQTNSYQAVNLVRKVSELVEGEKILDMYSGVGTFGIYLAKRGFNVKGFDSNEFAIEMARRNVEINNVDAEFEVASDREVSVKGFDTVIVDPPRAGLHPRLVKRLNREKPGVIVYVSCNPETFARDVKMLDYRIDEIVALDMFPHTPHVELVAKLV